MFLAEPLLIDPAAASGPPEASSPAPRLRAAAGTVLRRLSASRQLRAWHHRQRPSGRGLHVSERAWRRQSALICLRAGLDPEAGR